MCVLLYSVWYFMCIYRDVMCIYRDKSIELVSIHMYLYDISVSTLCNVPWSTVYIIISPLNCIYSYYLYDISVSTLCNVYLPWLLCVLLYYCCPLIFLFLPCVMCIYDYCVYYYIMCIYRDYLFLSCVMCIYRDYSCVFIILLYDISVSTMCIYRDYCVYHYKSTELVSFIVFVWYFCFYLV